MACLRLLTFLPELPDFKVPRFILCISRLTALPAFFEYFGRSIYGQSISWEAWKLS